MLKTWIKRLAKAAAGALLACVVAELFLVVFYPQERQTPLFDSTDAFPLALRKNVDGLHVSTEFDVRYRTNSHRLRDPERPLQKPDGVFRILVLGDSLTFGSGVDDADTFARQLESKLNARRDGRLPRVEVINAACASWGTADHVVFLDHLGLQFEPDVVLMAFHDDDPKDSRLSPFFRLGDDGALVERKYTPRGTSTLKKALDAVPIYGWLSQHSHLFSALRLRLVQFIKDRRAGEKQKTDILATKQRPPAVWPERDWKLAEALVARAKAKSEAAGATFLLVHAPFPRYNRAVEARIVAIAEGLGVPHLELIDRLERAGHATVYFPINRHLTPKGNAIVADALVDFLDTNAALPR